MLHLLFCVLATVFALPYLRYTMGGACVGPYCDVGWMSSPAYATIGSDVVIISGQYSFGAYFAVNGSAVWEIDSSSFSPSLDRMWSDVVVADMDGDGSLEVVSAHHNGWVTIHSLETGARVGSRRVFERELRSLAVGQLDAADTTLEIVIGCAQGSHVVVAVLRMTGDPNDLELVAGWPRMDDGDGYIWGVYNDNVALIDLDEDGHTDVLMPTDVHYASAWRVDGTELPTYIADRPWRQVGFCRYQSDEELGYCCCDCAGEHVPPETGPTSLYRTNFGHGPAAIGDVDNDGTDEIVLVGRSYLFCGGGAEDTRFNTPWIVNKDRSRWAASGFDWTDVRPGDEWGWGDRRDDLPNEVYNPVLADIDNDGILEILVGSYDGKLHVVWANQTELHAWPFSLPDYTGVGSFAAPPVVVDLDNDGSAEIITTVYTVAGSGVSGFIGFWTAEGSMYHNIPLPLDAEDGFSGSYASPTVIPNFDGLGNMGIAVMTVHDGLALVQINATELNNPRVLWGTGKGNFGRSGKANEPVPVGEGLGTPNSRGSSSSAAAVDVLF